MLSQEVQDNQDFTKDQEILQSWSRNYIRADRQLKVRQETTTARMGSLPSPITADFNKIAEETEP